MTPPLRDGVGIALMSAWVGAAILLAASVAPAAFAVLPTRTMAGDVVGRVLPVVFLSGIGVTVLCVVLMAPTDLSRRVLAAVTVIACGLAQYWISPRIARLRAGIGGAVDALAADNPQRVLFGRLHLQSVALLGVALLTGFIFIVLSLRAMRARP